ncbi:MAG: hypothetical protein KF890_07690 [Nitrospira sp.]|jgi:hypothetical protein|nr:hypothetical protein [Nitrospira sp.]
MSLSAAGTLPRMNDGSIQDREVNERSNLIMMGMRWTNWLGFAMLAIFIVIHEPIWLFLGFDTTGFNSTKILWVIPVAAYVIVAAVLLIRGGPDDDQP